MGGRCTNGEEGAASWGRGVIGLYGIEGAVARVAMP